ncbi:MAG: tetratricopeptide repeat protein [Bacteroidota bacterium]
MSEETLSYQDAVRLGEEAWEAIGEEEFERAKEIGQQLIAGDYESGYRVLGSVHEQMGETEEAEAVLKKGIETYPENWELFLHLGTLYSEANRLEEAIKVLEDAAKLENVESYWIDMNKAVVYYKMQDVDAALNTLQKVTHPDMFNEAFALQLSILDEVGRYDLLLEVVEEGLEETIPPENDQDAEVMSRICFYAAKACYKEEDEEATQFYLKQAIQYHRSNESTLELIRDIRAEYSDSATLYGIMVQALYEPETEEGKESFPFMTTYAVLAENEEEAMNYIRDFEIDDVKRESMQVMEVEIAEVEEGEESETEAKGIYMVGGMGFMDE